MTPVFLTHSPQALTHYYGEEALAGLRALGEVRLNPAGRELTLDELIAAAAGCGIIVSYRTAAAPARLFERLPELVAFSRCAIDIRNVDVTAASAAGVLVTQASAGFTASVAEWTVGVMIDLSRAISHATLAYRNGLTPQVVMGRELRGATLGIIGFGQIARYLAGLASAFGMRIVVHDPYVDARQMPSGIALAALDDVIAAADYLVCLATATDETENLMHAARFARMKPHAYFINPSRGNLVDEAALLDALDAGRLAGAALDVGRAADQMPSPLLAQHPRVIATPHVGGLTPPAIGHQALETVAQVARILEGIAPPGSVNADQASRLARLRRP